MTLEETLKQIKPLNEEKMKTARRRWDSIAKPLHSLGKMEDLITQIVGITGDEKVDLGKKALVAMCADNGVVEEGVTQTGQEVTAIVADNFVKETTTACVMCHQCGVDVKPVDVGMVRDTTARTDLKVMYGTRNMTKGPAMTRDEAIKGIEAGIAMAEELKAQGYRLFATGEMGIGNTTTSSAVAAALLDCGTADITGKGAGLSDEGLQHKIEVINAAREKYQFDSKETFRILCSVGGLDIAGLCGVCIGGAVYGVPVVLDGVISAVSALVAERLVPGVKDFLIASHKSREPAAALILQELGVHPVIDGALALGEGTGAVLMFGLLDTVHAVYDNRTTFSDIRVEAYRRFTEA